MSRIVWQGQVRKQDVRVVKDDDEQQIAERNTGCDALGIPRWETILTEQALSELREIIPKDKGIEIKPPPDKADLPCGLVMLPKGLTFQDLTRVNSGGIRGLLLTFPIGFDQDGDNLDAIEKGLNGERCTLVLDGRYERGSFGVRSVAHFPESVQPIVDTHGCEMVNVALRHHLKHGDPEERFSLAGVTITAQKLLSLLETNDKRALGFVQDIHEAALRAVRHRQRQPSRVPRW